MKRFICEKLKMWIVFYTAIIASLKMRSEKPTTNKSVTEMLLVLCEEWLGDSFNNLWVVMAIGWDSWGLVEERSVIPAFKKGKEGLRNYRLVSLTLIPGEVVEQLILEAVSKHKRDKMVIRGSQQGFMKKSSSFTNWIAFSNVMTTLVEEMRSSGCCLPWP